MGGGGGGGFFFFLFSPNKFLGKTFSYKIYFGVGGGGGGGGGGIFNFASCPKAIPSTETFI